MMYVRLWVYSRFTICQIHWSSLCTSLQLSAFSLTEMSLVKSGLLLVFPVSELLLSHQRPAPVSLVKWYFRTRILLSESLIRRKTFHCLPLYLQFDGCVFFLIAPRLPLKVSLVCCTIQQMLPGVGTYCLDLNNSLFLLNFLENSISLLIERPAHWKWIGAIHYYYHHNRRWSQTPVRLTWVSS